MYIQRERERERDGYTYVYIYGGVRHCGCKGIPWASHEMASLMHEGLPKSLPNVVCNCE